MYSKYHSGVLRPSQWPSGAVVRRFPIGSPLIKISSLNHQSSILEPKRFLVASAKIVLST